jgi:hypothetical protein
MLGQEMRVESNTISMQRWDLAPNVFRFTLSQVLEPGEYVLAELTEDGINLYVWDFGVERTPAKPPASPPQPH